MKIFYFLPLKKVIYRLSAKSILHSETFSKKGISSYPNSHLFLHIQTKLKLHKNWHELSEQLRTYIHTTTKLAPFHMGSKNSNIETSKVFRSPPSVVHRAGRFFLAGYNFHYGVSILLAPFFMAGKQANKRTGY